MARAGPRFPDAGSDTLLRSSSSPGPSILGGVDTPQNAANAPGAAPRHAASSLTVLTVLSTLALALAL